MNRAPGVSVRRSRSGMGRVRRAALALAAAVFPLAACSPEDKPDAYGNFEATEVVVSAEASGQLVRFQPDAGEHLATGATVGVIDTTSITLQRRELRARLESAASRAAEAVARIDVLAAQLATARDEYERTRRLFRAEAATAQQLNRTRGEVRALEQRIEAARAQAEAAREDTGVIQAQLEQIELRLRKSRITNPVAGTVLVAYTEAGEFVTVGQPLYEIAELDTMILRAYVSGGQLAGVRLGERVQVRIDVGEDELRTLPGVVSWIADEAEFTPTPIQTREERTALVYAVEVRVPNPNGLLKIGMPGEVEFE